MGKSYISTMALGGHFEKNVNNYNCPRVTPPHPPESLNRGSGQQYSAKTKTIYSKSRYTTMAAGLQSILNEL